MNYFIWKYTVALKNKTSGLILDSIFFLPFFPKKRHGWRNDRIQMLHIYDINLVYAFEKKKKKTARLSFLFDVCHLRRDYELESRTSIWH